ELVAEGNVRHADTAMVNVTTNPTPLTLASLSIDPIAPDSALWAMAASNTPVEMVLPGVFSGMWSLERSLTPRALDPIGTPIPGLVIEYASLDPTILRVNRFTGALTTAGAPGQVQLTARTTAYGVT